MIEALRAFILANPGAALAGAGFCIGFGFGVLVRLTNFCIMGAVSDWRLFGDRSRLGAAALASAAAIIGAQLLQHFAIVDLSRSIYLMPRINWASAIFGGLSFGYGMMYAGGCASSNVVRAGAGDMRSMLTLLVMSIMALATIGGVLGPARNWIEINSAIGIDQLGLKGAGLTDIGARLGLDVQSASLTACLLLVVPLLAFAAGPGRVFSQPRNLIGGLGVGLLVVAAWFVTGLAFDDMAVHPLAPTSLSFVKPVGDAVGWMEHATALGFPGFAAATVFGALAGSFIAALSTGTLRAAGFASRDDMLSHLGGAALMGVGGVLGLGCSIGQGISGLSTLAIQSVITTAAIIGGAVLALTRLQKTI